MKSEDIRSIQEKLTDLGSGTVVPVLATWEIAYQLAKINERSEKEQLTHIQKSIIRAIRGLDHVLNSNGTKRWVLNIEAENQIRQATDILKEIFQ